MTEAKSDAKSTPSKPETAKAEPAVAKPVPAKPAAAKPAAAKPAPAKPAVAKKAAPAKPAPVKAEATPAAPKPAAPKPAAKAAPKPVAKEEPKPAVAKPAPAKPAAAKKAPEPVKAAAPAKKPVAKKPVAAKKPAAKPAAPAPSPVVAVAALETPEAIKAQIEQLNVAAKEMLDNVLSMHSDAVSEISTKAEEQAKALFDASSNLLKECDDMFADYKENMDTLVAASNTMVKVNQDVAEELAAFAKTSVEESVEASKKLMGITNPSEAMELQAGLAKEGFDKLVAEGTKVGDMYTKAIETAFGPMGKQFTEQMQKMMKPAA